MISFKKVVKSGEVGCWLAVVGSLVGVFWLRVMWLELSSRSEISCPLWSVVGEYHWQWCVLRSPVSMVLSVVSM